MAPLIVVLVILANLVINVVVIRRRIRRMRVEAVGGLRETVGGERVFHVEDCNYFGWLSGRSAQLRGNGLLALTDRGIHFRMLVPRRQPFIPLEDLSSVSMVRSFLGKSKGRKILRVDFRAAGGREDACAFLVLSLEWWVSALRSLLSGKEPPPAPRKTGD